MSSSGVFTPWQVQLFDGPLARRDGVVISHFRSQKIAALFAYLCLFQNRRHTREELTDLLWPDETVEAGRSNLRTALASLRRQFEPDGTPSGSIIVTEGQTYVCINPAGVVVDVAEFEGAIARGDNARAVSLYAGPLLRQVMADWVTAERERLDEAYRAAKVRMEAVSESTPPAPAAPSPPITPPVSPEKAPPRRALPATISRFFGREMEREALGRLLRPSGDESARLVTLTGPGGSGKTRLSIETARALTDAFTGVFFVPFADVREGERLPDAIAEVLRLPSSHTIARQKTVIAALNAIGGPVLLVLDNAEHLTEAVANLARTLLDEVPRLSLLVTSRQRLLVAGEREVPIAPLPVPELPGTPERLLEFAGVQLFVNRAQAMRPDFQLTARNVESVVALCRKLEGIPLAIELAAGWVQTLTIPQMLERLENRFDLLVSRRRDISPRHATLRAAIESSVRLLPEDVQRFFAKLSVFEGGWTAEAAEGVLEEGDSAGIAIEHLALLRDHSLVVTESGPGEEIRFRMLETLREYAGEQLTAEEREALARRHAEYFKDFACDVAPMLFGEEQTLYLNRLAADHHNFRAALAWCRRTDGAENTGLQMVFMLYRLFLYRALFREGVATMQAMLAHNPEQQGIAERGSVLNALGILARHLGDYDLARESLTESRDLHKQIDKPRGVANALANLGMLALTIGDYETARIRTLEAIEILEQIQRQHSIAICLGNLGIIARMMDNLPEAENYHQESLSIMQDRKDRSGIALCLYDIGNLEKARGEYDTALARYRESLRHRAEMDDPEGIYECLYKIALVRGGNALPAETAVRLLGASEVLREAHSLSLLPYERYEYDSGLAALREELGNETFDALWAAGRNLTREEAVRIALAERGQDTAPAANGNTFETANGDHSRR
jgi:predicted ATPase